MKKICVFLANGLEECEGLLVVDLLRRAKLEVTTVSVTGEYMVQSSHEICIKADKLFEEMDFSNQDMLVLPGGIPGTPNLRKHEGLMGVIQEFAADENKNLAAICAAPTIFAELGLLQGKPATSHPSMQEQMEKCGVNYSLEAVVKTGRIITSCGLGAAIPFGLALITLLVNEEEAARIKSAIVF